jgi:alanine racemase
MVKDELDEYHGYGAKWVGRVQQLYKEKQTLAVTKAKGYTLKGREVVQTPEGQQVRLQFVARR